MRQGALFPPRVVSPLHRRMAMHHKTESMKAADDLFHNWAERHSTLLVMLAWLVIFVAGLAVLYTTTGTQ